MNPSAAFNGGPRPTGRVPETIGARIKRLRQERSLSQRDISSPGVSFAYVSRIESGIRRPSVKAIRKLAFRLGVSPEYLEYGVDGDPRELREARLANIELALELDDPVTLADDEIADLVEHSRQASDTALALRASLARIRLALARGDEVEAVRQLKELLANGPESLLADLPVATQLGRLLLDSGCRRDARDLLFPAGDYALTRKDPEESPPQQGAGGLFATLSEVIGLEEAGARCPALLASAEAHQGNGGLSVRWFRAWSEQARTSGDLRAALQSARKATAELDLLDAHREIATGMKLYSDLVEDAGRASTANATPEGSIHSCL